MEARVSVPDAPVDVKKPNRPSVEVRKPKKGLFGGLSLKKPSCKISIEVSKKGCENGCDTTDGIKLS